MKNDNDTGALVELARRYSEGIGCDRSIEKALELYEKAGSLGDRYGASGLATLYAALADECSDPSQKEKYNRLQQEWNDVYMEMWHKSLLEDPDEYDRTLEED